MQQENSIYSNKALPISGLEKIGDLINLNGPILSLFKDEMSHHYIFYWVDNSESSNTWMICKAADENLYNYLKGDISLLDLLTIKDKDYVFIVDIDESVIFSNVVPVELRLIPAQYLPAPKSYYKLPLPYFATDFMNAYETSGNYYKFLMRSKSIVFNISPTITNFPRAVTTADASSFLSKITRSINGFVEEMFWAAYKDIIKSSTEYNRLLNQVKELLAPRLFDLKFGSFEVSVGVDTVKKLSIDNFTDWQRNIIPEYRNDVVNVDYGNLQQLQQIAEKYSEEAREKIYEPYIKIINSTHYSLVVKDKANKIIKSYSKVDKEKEEMVVPRKKASLIDKEKGKKFFSLVVEISEGQTVDELNKKLLQSGLLFSEQVSEVSRELHKAQNDVLSLYFSQPIPFSFSVKNNMYSVYVTDLGLYLEHQDKNILFQHLENQIVNIYLSVRDVEEDDSTKLYFEAVIDRVEGPDGIPY